MAKNATNSKTGSCVNGKQEINEMKNVMYREAEQQNKCRDAVTVEEKNARTEEHEVEERKGDKGNEMAEKRRQRVGFVEDNRTDDRAFSEKEQCKNKNERQDERESENSQDRKLRHEEHSEENRSTEIFISNMTNPADNFIYYTC